jgi:glycosyltransferase involved in cell wall biosynthesis
MKIMTSMYTLRKGGAYDRFLMMLEALLERGCEVHCLSLGPIPLNHPCYYNHVVAVPLGWKRGRLAKLTVLLTFPWFSLLIGWRKKADLFVSFGPLYAFLHAFAKWVLRKPMVTLVRLDLSLKFKKEDLFSFVDRMNKFIEYGGLLFTDRIIAVNTAMKQEISETIWRLKEVETEVLFNSIPDVRKSSQEERARTRDQLGIPRETKLFVTAGVLTPRKNIEILLKSLSRMGREDWALLVIGDNSDRGNSPYVCCLRELTRKLNLEKKVTFPGWYDKQELWKVLSAADLFVLPSCKEGMPNVLLEALGVDVPCLGSNVPGIRDILQHDILMFDPFDEETLTRKITLFFSEKGFSGHLLQLCRERKQKFSFDWKTKAFEMITKPRSSRSLRGVECA